MVSIVQLARKAMKYYPDSKFMRKQWIEKTIYLVQNKKHILYDENKVKWGHDEQK